MSLGQKFSSNIKKLYLLFFLEGAHLFSAVLVPFFTDWGNLGMGQILFLQFWFMFWIFALEVPTGAIADHFGRKKSVALGRLFWGVGAITYAIIPDFRLFLLSEFLMAVGAALVSGADEAIAYDTLREMKQEKKAKDFLGRLESTRLSGILVTGIAGSFVAGWLGITWPMRLSAVGPFVAVLVALSLKEPSIGRLRAHKNYFRTLFSGVRIFLRKKTVKILAFDGISTAISGYFVIWFYQLFLKELGFPIFYFGFVHAGLVVGQLIVAGKFSWLESRFREKRGYLSASAFLTGSAVLALAFAKTPWLAIFLAIVACSFGMTRWTLISSYINKHIPSRERATVLSAVSMGKRASIAIANLVVGFFAGFSAHWTLAGIGIFAILAAIFSRIEERHLK
ncbi:MAG: MFS transporter [archaeon]